MNSALAIVLGAHLAMAIGLGLARAEPARVTLGTATPGGGFPVYGDALIAAIKAADPELVIEARNTKGSAENVPLLVAGKLDIALVQGESAYEALNGIGQPKADLRIFTAMYSSPGMFVVKAASPARSIDDLKGQPVAFGASGSGLVILARYVLDGLDLDQKRDFRAVFLDRAGDGPATVEDGRVAALWGGGIGWPGFTAVAKSPGGARFIVPSPAELARIQAKHPFLKTLVVPAGSYPGQTEAITSVGSWSWILTRRDLPDEIAFRLAKALHAAEPDLARRLPQAAETTARNTIAALPRRELLHPGVGRYFKEQGWLR
ncbi:MAG: TAXI family TRAP transporter solute-binding subunit [Proteobacteria bacterium]|nr:TAXI family TRAP transporter solute-binding subunit [Pseudomonadota bacterium]